MNVSKGGNFNHVPIQIVVEVRISNEWNRKAKKRKKGGPRLRDEQSQVTYEATKNSHLSPLQSSRQLMLIASLRAICAQFIHCLMVKKKKEKRTIFGLLA